ncbi:putative Methionine-R-sulfoxide reductase B1 [Hypsibius exemplaris]|uniref:peptide-methionine (R)-S-oxide reductase n=1 Tax=Hypsibius exemplaris TaxID=2072580 RepID=A0A1W0W9Y1_HYPEX|nr:putative Methionine-R-sulfoxide reductase B1 [Hypsibius exemplaris]
MSFCSFNGGEKYKDHFQPGIYTCSKCGFELFGSHSKYQHSSPWPAFTETVHADSLSKVPETIPQSKPNALKVSCGRCGQGLGWP